MQQTIFCQRVFTLNHNSYKEVYMYKKRMITHNDIFAIVTQKGPILPAQISELVSADTMLIGALLSDLVSSKRILITKQQWSGSPLYYIEEQKEQIQKLFEKMNEKDKHAFTLLQEQKVLQDSTQTPLLRTCLRSIKDFAIPLKVKTPNGEELFWKWYLLDNAQVIPLLKERFFPKTQTETPIVPTKVSAQDVPKVEKTTVQPTITPTSTEEIETPKSIPTKTPTAVTTSTAGSLLPYKDEFFEKFVAFTQTNDIRILQVDSIRKETEFDVTLELSTPLTTLVVYAKIKNKKKSTDADLSQAFVKGSLQKLPIFYIHTGELTKKAKELLETDFQSVSVYTFSL